MIDHIKKSAHQTHNIVLQEREIWRGARRKDLARTTREFVWMTIHDAYMVAGYAQVFKERSKCQICLQTETMEHILTKCNPTRMEVS